MAVKIAFGYDDERPYGKLALTEKGKDLREKNLRFVAELIKFFIEKRIPCTFFILGQYLEYCIDEFSVRDLREIYRPENSLIDIQQHSYSHPPLKPLPEDKNRPVVSTGYFLNDVQQAGSVISSALGRITTGLRTPYGYASDLSDKPDLVERLSKFGFKFVSSWLRGSDGSLEAELTLARQPRTYADADFPQLVEIPSHGWQDVVFTKEKARALLNREPLDSDEIATYYDNLLLRGLKLAREKSPVYICLCLHPWAVMEYDLKLFIHQFLVDRAKDLKIEIVSYSQIAKEVANASNS